MKALTKPEKFRAMSRIYGYECDWDVAPGRDWVENWWGGYDCEDTCDHQDINC